jgi:hypothetical protein
MKTSNLFLVVVSSVLLTIVYSCGSSNENSSGGAASSDSAPTLEEKTAHEQLLSEGWSYLGSVEVDLKDSDNHIISGFGPYCIYFKDNHYTAVNHLNQYDKGYFARYPVKKGSYRLMHYDEKYTYNGRFNVKGDEYYFNL